jgi:hypothetical protein
MESQAGLNNCELVANGTVHGRVTGLLYQPSQGNYKGTGGGTYTKTQLVRLISNGDTLTLLGVAPGTGAQFAFGRVSN